MEFDDHEQELDENDPSLLTTKPILYVCNVSEDDFQPMVAMSGVRKLSSEFAGSKKKTLAILVSSAMEAEIAQLDAEEQKEFLESLRSGRTRPPPSDS